MKVARNYLHGKVTMGGGHTMGPQLGPPHNSEQLSPWDMSDTSLDSYIWGYACAKRGEAREKFAHNYFYRKVSMGWAHCGSPPTRTPHNSEQLSPWALSDTSLESYI